MKVFITKYALTRGIEEADVTECGNGMVKVGYAYYHGEGRDWHRTKESAIKRAEDMLIKKITSLRKTLAKFEKLRFK